MKEQAKKNKPRVGAGAAAAQNDVAEENDIGDAEELAQARALSMGNALVGRPNRVEGGEPGERMMANFHMAMMMREVEQRNRERQMILMAIGGADQAR